MTRFSYSTETVVSAAIGEGRADVRGETDVRLHLTVDEAHESVDDLCRLAAYLAEWQGCASPAPPFDGLRTEAEAAAKLTPPPSPRKARRPSLATQIRRAEKSGREVTSVTLPDGTKLNFGEGEPSEANNPWLDDLKVTKPLADVLTGKNSTLVSIQDFGIGIQ